MNYKDYDLHPLKYKQCINSNYVNSAIIIQKYWKKYLLKIKIQL